MKEIKLMIDGKEVALTKEQIEALGIDVYDGCVCDRADDCEMFWFVSSTCEATADHEEGYCVDDELFKSGNYYRSGSYAKQVALHQKLNNLLRRFSEQHGGDSEWDGCNQHWSVCGIPNGTVITSFAQNVKEVHSVYFKSQNIAESAIEEVVKPFMAEHPEFVW